MATVFALALLCTGRPAQGRAGDLRGSLEVPAQRPAREPRVLWLMTRGVPTELAQAAKNAAFAHMGHLTVELLDGWANRDDLAGLVAEARQFADVHEAVGVFFVLAEVRHAALYLYEPKTHRLWVQRATLSPESQAAAEEIALIAASAARALLSQVPVGMELTPLPPPAPTANTQPLVREPSAGATPALATRPAEHEHERPPEHDGCSRNAWSIARGESPTR